MPIRQPNSGVSPAPSACSSRVAPVFAAVVPARVNATSPSALPPATTGVLNHSTRSWSEPSYAACTALIIGAGPHAQVGTSR